MNNKLTDEEITELALKLFDGSSFYFQSGRRPGAKTMAKLLNKAACAVAELQERRKAEVGNEPVRYMNKFSGACVTLEQQPNAADDAAVYVPLYAAPQPATVTNEFIPKNLDRALGVVGVALPESKEEFNLQIERWTQRLIDRVIRYSDEFCEQPELVVPDECKEAPAYVKVLTKDGAYIYGFNACRDVMLQGGAK